LHEKIENRVENLLKNQLSETIGLRKLVPPSMDFSERVIPEIRNKSSFEHLDFHICKTE